MTSSDIVSYARDVGRSLAWDLQAVGNDSSMGLADVVTQVMDSHLHRLAETGCWGPENRLPSSAFWSEAAPWMQLGSLQWHARDKPAGYAGDFRLLERIGQRDVQGTSLGRALDEYFQNHPAPQAVRNRAEFMARRSVDLVRARRPKRTHVVSVGSGPGLELYWTLQRLEAPLRSALRITLIDMDPRALEFAAARLKPLLPLEDQLQLVRTNLGRLPRVESEVAKLPAAQLLFCSGFFDYLGAEAAHEMLSYFGRLLADDGECLVFNFSQYNPSRAYMEWVANWYLQYRTESELDALAQHAGFGQCEVGVEPSGVNLYLQLKEPRSREWT